MYCTSLGRRKTWAPAVPRLRQHDKWKFTENKIGTHDVNLPLPNPAEPGQRYLRFVLLSSEDSDLTARLQRVARLYHHTGGTNAAVVWLLGTGGDLTTFAQFQTELMQNFDDIPLIPLPSIEELPTTLLKFRQSFLQAYAVARQQPVRTTSAVQSLLPYCALSPPLGEHSIGVLRNRAVGFAELANKARSAAGRTELLEYLGDEEAKRIVWFWMAE